MNRLIYVYDALCGWCFGFSGVMKIVQVTYPDVPIEVISGGLMLGERVGPIGEVAPYVKSAYKDVEARTGVRFGEAFVNGGLVDGSLQLNSLPPAIALAVFRDKFPHRQLAYAHALHDVIYVHGHSSEDVEAMAEAAAALGFEKEDFLKAYHMEEYEDLAKQDFLHAQQLQVTGYPALIAQTTDGQYYLVAKGYTPEDVLLERLQKVYGDPK